MLTRLPLTFPSHTGDMLALVAAMEDVVEALDEGSIPNKVDYPSQSFEGYVKSLVNAQVLKSPDIQPGHWCVAASTRGMPGDARVDFVFRPTYAAVATLSRVLLDLPWIAIRTPRFRTALQKGMRFAAYRELQGHGYDTDQGRIDALRILSLGKVPLLLEHAPGLCPKLYESIRLAASDMAARLTRGEAQGAWGEDLSSGFRQALETLRLVNDPEFMRSLEDAKHDPITIERKDWKW